MKTKTKSVVLAINLLLTVTANAQVTIGSDSKPSQAALLDLKTQDNTAGGVTSTQGGVLFPRVALQEVGSLKPFIADGGSAIDKSTNKGMVVYNLTTTSPFTEGLYTWNGTQWTTQTSQRYDIPYYEVTGLVLDKTKNFHMLSNGSTIWSYEFPDYGTYLVNIKVRITGFGFLGGVTPTWNPPFGCARLVSNPDPNYYTTEATSDFMGSYEVPLEPYLNKTIFEGVVAIHFNQILTCNATTGKKMYMVLAINNANFSGYNNVITVKLGTKAVPSRICSGSVVKLN